MGGVALAAKESVFVLSDQMPFALPFNANSLFTRANVVINFQSSDATTSTDLGGSHSLMSLYSNIDTNFSPSERFKKGKQYKQTKSAHKNTL